jgi:hypothetical protein
MANVKISELPVATSVDVVDTVPLVQGGTTKQATQAALLTTTGNVTAAKLVPTGGAATGNGMYLPATNTLAWSTNGAEGMRLDSSGNLGLGVTPSAWGTGIKSFQVGNYSALTNSQGGYTWLSNNAFYDTAWKYLTTNRALYYAQDTGDGGHKWFTAPSGTAGNAISFTQAMTLTSGGDLLVGVTSAQTWNSGEGGPIQTGGARPIILSNLGGNISFRGDTGGWAMGMYAFGSSNTARGGFGFTGGADSLSHYWVGTAFNGTGVQLNSGSTSWSTLSDARDKNVHGEIEDALAKIAGIRGVYYNFKTDGIDRRRRVGFIAQDVNAVFPEAVEETQREIDNPTEDTKRLVLSYTELVPLLLNGIKEQQAIINDLRARVAALEA